MYGTTFGRTLRLIKLTALYSTPGVWAFYARVLNQSKAVIIFKPGIHTGSMF